MDNKIKMYGVPRKPKLHNAIGAAGFAYPPTKIFTVYLSNIFKNF